MVFLSELKTLSDEELLGLARSGNEDAYLVLMSRYRRYAHSKACVFYKNHSDSGIEFNDFVNAAIFGFSIAIEKYIEKSSSFFAYWFVVADNEIRRVNNENSYLHKGRQFAGISLDACRDDNFSNAEVLGEEDESLSFDDAPHVVNTIISDPNFKLKSIEKMILSFILEGYEFLEIRQQLALSKNQLYYALKQIKQKVVKHLKY